MVNHVVPREELESFTLALAEKIAQKPSFALKLAKEAVNQTLEAQGQWQAMLAVFNLHQLAHSHNQELYGMRIDPSGIPGAVRRQ
jgi:enoyl-CoA hydratase